jgi:hypothetical protein
LPRPGRVRQITDDATAWVLHCACERTEGGGLCLRALDAFFAPTTRAQALPGSGTPEFGRTQQIEAEPDFEARRDSPA